MFALESPHRSDSDDYTQHTIFNIKKKITLNHPNSVAMGFSKGFKNEIESAVVNEPSVFDQLNIYCIIIISSLFSRKSFYASSVRMRAKCCFIKPYNLSLPLCTKHSLVLKPFRFQGMMLGYTMHIAKTGGKSRNLFCNESTGP